MEPDKLEREYDAEAIIEPIISHYVAPIEMTRDEFRAIAERVDAGENLDVLLAEHRADRQPCVFAEVHGHPAFASVHDEGATVLMEWFDDEAIYARGPRSRVCQTQASLSVRLGTGRRVDGATP